MSMKWLGNFLMSRRSQGLIARLRDYLPQHGTIANIGSGTGHNAEAIRRFRQLQVREFDVADLHWLGPGPELISDSQIPVDDGVFDGLILFFVLQYPDSPEQLLRECRRVTNGPLLIIQSTYRGQLGRFVLAIREFFWGRFALYVATVAGLIQPVKCRLKPRHVFTRFELSELFARVGLIVVERVPAEWLGLGVSRDLFVLKSEEF